MKLLGITLLSAAAVSHAFVPRASRAATLGSRDASLFAEEKVPFFATDSKPAEPVVAEAAPEEPAVEASTDEEVSAEIKKAKRVSNLRNSAGVDYAPWMRITAEDEAKIKQVMKEKAE